MSQEKKDIGSIYRDAFKQHQVADQSDEWSAISHSLRKSRFMRFSFTSFNIYYSVLLVSVFLISAALLIHHFFIKEPEAPGAIKNNTQEITAPANSIIESSDEGTNKIVPYIQKGNAGSSPQQTTVSQQDTIVSAPQEVEMSDTISPVTVPPTPVAPVPKTVKKNTVYVTKQDTLVVYDTLKAKKPRKKSF